MKIPTANIVVAFNQETMERLFSSGATYKSLVAQLADGEEDALLFNNVGNPNFESFEHSLGLGAGMTMTLTFIDPKDEFERRFFTDNPAKLIQGFSNPQAEKTTSFITDKPDDVDQSQSEYSKEYVAQYKQELKNSIGSRDIYVAYGTGNNLDLWSGPHRTILTNANIEVTGSKKITITLTPTSNAFDIGTRRGAYNERINLNLQGLKVRCEGTSQEIKFTKSRSYSPGEYLDIGFIRSLDIEQFFALRDLGYEDLLRKLQKFDFHAMVVDTLRTYIQKATSNKNVIVLLPNLNVTCRQAINDEARKFNVIDSSGLAETTKRVAALAATDVSAQLGDQASKTPNIGSLKAARADDIFEKLQSKNGKTELFVESTLKAFGLRMHTVERERLATLEQKAEPTGAVNVMASNEKNKNANQAFENFYADRIFTAVIDKTDRQIPDHKAVVQEIFDRIRKMSQESYKMSSLAIMTESELDVIKLWQDNGDEYTFAGYDKFVGTNPIIVGDLALIKEYLFGGVNLNAKAEAASELRAKAAARQKKEDELLLSGVDLSSLKGPTALDLKLASVTQIPLHPLDQIVLTDKKYNETVRKIMNPVLKGSGAFGDISYIPDEFAYRDKSFSDKEKQDIEENGIPVFRYNTQNPNILDIKFNFGAIYFSLLKIGYQKEIGRLTSAVAEGVLPTGIGTFPIRTRGAAIGYLRSKGFSQGLGDEDKKKLIQGLLNRAAPELGKEINLDSAEAAADSIASILEDAKEKNLHPLVLVDQELPGNPNSIMADFSEDLYRKALQMNITTLPLFHISRVGSINNPCVVFAQDQPITQVERKERTGLNKFFSGVYKIMGFKHTITTTTATSEFKLVKNVPNDKVEG